MAGPAAAWHRLEPHPAMRGPASDKDARRDTEPEHLPRADANGKCFSHRTGIGPVRTRLRPRDRGEPGPLVLSTAT
ncbi:protein of unknown function [Rhodovastum atsumiense]|nr:protein of unknown function [Rhodovastum atsumiense]